MTKAELKKLARIKPHNRSEAQWNAIYDARTLANAEQIKMDDARYNTAKTWASVLLLEEKEETEAMQNVVDA